MYKVDEAKRFLTVRIETLIDEVLYLSSILQDLGDDRYRDLEEKLK